MDYLSGLREHLFLYVTEYYVLWKLNEDESDRVMQGKKVKVSGAGEYGKGNKNLLPLFESERKVSCDISGIDYHHVRIWYKIRMKYFFFWDTQKFDYHLLNNHCIIERNDTSMLLTRKII